MVQDSLLEFADKMGQIMPVIMNKFAGRLTKELFKERITLPQFFILVCLEKEGESKMTSLAHVMNVSTAAMTGVIERLVKYGYVQRNTDPRDRRIVKIKLTVKGTELIRKMNQQRREMIIKIFGKISETDRQDYLRILTQIKDILVQEPK